MTAPDGKVDLLRQGIERNREGDKAGARRLFEQLAEARPDHETVWLWLASVAPDAAASAGYLEKALEVDPGNQQARGWLERLRPRTAERSGAWRCPLCSQSFTARPGRCARCRAELELSDLEPFFAEPAPELDRELIEDAIERARADVALSAQQRHRILAFAYLNLRQYQKALRQLSAWAALRPNDIALERAVEGLTERLEREPAASSPGRADLRSSGHETTEIDGHVIREAIAMSGAKRPNVLVVDDSPTVRTVLSEVLERRGYRTYLAESGMEALTRIQETMPDLVLLDVTMPHLDGFKICRVLKDNDLTAHVPVVFLSGKDGFLDKVRGRMAGAADYLAKPVAEETLLQVLDRHLRPLTKA